MRKPALSSPEFSNQVHGTETARHVLHSNSRVRFCLKSGSTSGGCLLIIATAPKAHQDEDTLQRYAFATSLYPRLLIEPPTSALCAHAAKSNSNGYQQTCSMPHVAGRIESFCQSRCEYLMRNLYFAWWRSRFASPEGRLQQSLYEDRGALAKYAVECATLVLANLGSGGTLPLLVGRINRDIHGGDG
ncbi:hypothetical protein HBH98_153250 [Parastagonospora nodorum]|nr:hypothetical protein HBH53_156840 [Parastagonospora nodorum]KAH3995231.1 hypothetical protein HBI10_176400 [Parastagonospora nodorum]KAH4015545.1 hypothetical protein HBI09_205600 [Parastagonospora nodorum]KAH4017575.1 hypothetical protein HBI13_141930 [Parastagonospora nodorum]KAH4063220.1 hypothetical protein HBH50_193990 [Parastagonospora nodorum]